MSDVPEKLNPLLKPGPLQAADEAACRLDGMFRDLFNVEDRRDLIVTIIRASIEASSSPTLWGQIAAVYGELDAEDCAMVDREWLKFRGMEIRATFARASGSKT